MQNIFHYLTSFNRVYLYIYIYIHFNPIIILRRFAFFIFCIDRFLRNRAYCIRLFLFSIPHSLLHLLFLYAFIGNITFLPNSPFSRLPHTHPLRLYHLSKYILTAYVEATDRPFHFTSSLQDSSVLLFFSCWCLKLFGFSYIFIPFRSTQRTYEPLANPVMLLKT